MDITVFTELEFFFRILIAGICGGLIGYERNNRLKEAGIRTHLIVALAAALIMVVSKYGFSDVTTLKGVALDPSRIAAQIVTGVGFLGAGMIFVRNQTISGLTTAAGVWATAGIGMTIGAGLYFLGVAATLLIVAAPDDAPQKLYMAQLPRGRADLDGNRGYGGRCRLHPGQAPESQPRNHQHEVPE